MDTEDENFLDELNLFLKKNMTVNKRHIENYQLRSTNKVDRSQKYPILNEDQFESVIDLFEKESYKQVYFYFIKYFKFFLEI